MTATKATGLDGLILIDAWNIAAGTSKGAVSKAELVRGFDDFGNSLHGASPESVADEVVARRSEWDLVAAAPRLSSLRILTVSARYGIGADNRTTTAALRNAGNRRVTAIEMDTDHAFSDHRIALASTVVRWLQALPIR